MTKLRALRADRGGPRSSSRPLTIRDLGERTGFSIAHLSNVEQGVKQAGDGLVSALARVYRLPVAKMRQICTETFVEAGNARMA